MTDRTCVGCGKPMVTKAAWRTMTADQRAHVVVHAARGDCTSCRPRRRAGRLGQPLLRQRTRFDATPAPGPAASLQVPAEQATAAARVVARYALDDTDRDFLLGALGLTA